MRNYIFGSGTYARLLSRTLKQGIVQTLDGFWVEKEFEQSNAIEGYSVSSNPEDLFSARVFIGVTLQKRKGPDIWRRVADLIITHGGLVGGFCAGSVDTQYVSETACVYKFVNIEMDAVIGALCHVRPNVFIGHDAQLGECCYIAPSASIGSYCQIAGDAFIGFGAVVLPERIIGSNVVIAGGAVIAKDVPDNSIVLRDGSIIGKKNPFVFI